MNRYRLECLKHYQDSFIPDEDHIFTEQAEYVMNSLNLPYNTDLDKQTHQQIDILFDMVTTSCDWATNKLDYIDWRKDWFDDQLTKPFNMVRSSIDMAIATSTINFRGSYDITWQEDIIIPVINGVDLVTFKIGYKVITVPASIAGYILALITDKIFRTRIPHYLSGDGDILKYINTNFADKPEIIDFCTVICQLLYHKNNYYA